ncbi:Transposase IS4 [Popillia japonica]|uniref:Transposase IS4 n=1 Tax=Popillia japonica TaxID=7064 RepID=A0AAW1HUL2_POPJA
MGQYIKNKPHKYGVKLYKLCTVTGFTYNVRVYCGKEDSIGSRDHSHNVVLKLMSGLLNSGRTLYADNFYSGLPLVMELLHRQILYCGILRKNRRGLPGEIVIKNLKKNEIFGQENQHGIKIIQWQGERPVLMLSSKPEHSVTLCNTGKKARLSKNGEPGKDILKPKVVLDYNNAKKGVDYSDQMSAYYSSLRKGLKWYFAVIDETAADNEAEVEDHCKDSDDARFTYNVRVYCGKEDSIGSRDHSHNVVLKLMSGLLNSGRTLYADNFYSGLPLVMELLHRQILYCGILRKNRRGLPGEIVIKNLKKNEIFGQENQHGIKIIQWQGERPVLMLSSKPEHSVTLCNTGKKARLSKNGEPGKDILKPKVVLDYNNAKKGVDYSDQMSAYYSSLRKGLKWYFAVIDETAADNEAEVEDHCKDSDDASK